jgi:hypothetical protein
MRIKRFHEAKGFVKILETLNGSRARSFLQFVNVDTLLFCNTIRL